MILPVISQASIALQKVDALGLSLASQIESEEQKNTERLSFKKFLSFSEIIHNYSDEKGDQHFALGPVNITFYPGELIFIVGGNGSGKSTLAKLITGLYAPDVGSICIDGQNITSYNREDYRQLFSAVFSDFYLFESLLGINYVELDKQIQTILSRLQLTHKVQVEDGLFSTLDLSQGQRKRIALLTAYLEDRPVYLFDEWAADQDPFFRDIFYGELLPELKNRGKTIIVISHDDRYFHTADKLIKLEYGKIVEIQDYKLRFNGLAEQSNLQSLFIRRLLD
jgi:putative pyoverdin transport system ATP-binding/permease protein